MGEVLNFLGLLVDLIGVCTTVHYGRQSSSPPSDDKLQPRKHEE